MMASGSGAASGPTRCFVLGIDFGGTKVALGAAGAGGELLESVRLENAGRPAADVVAHALEAAAELVYSLRGPHDAAGARDGRAPLEEAVGGRAIGERAAAMGGDARTAADAFAARDGALAELVEDALAELSVHVANLAVLVDPAR